MICLICLLFSLIITLLLNYNSFSNILLIFVELIGFFLCGLILSVLIAELLAFIYNRKCKKVIVPKKIFHFFTLSYCKLVWWFCGIKIIYKGIDKIDYNREYLFISNHQSNFDPLILIKAFPRLKLTFLMKQELMKIKILSNYLSAAGFYSLDRNNNREGLKTILNVIEACKSRTVGVFPEGTRSLNGELLPFRDGIFKVAHKTNADILICALDNTRYIKKRFPFRRTKVVIDICGIISNEEAKNMTTIEIGDNVSSVIKESIMKNKEEYKFYE